MMYYGGNGGWGGWLGMGFSMILFWAVVIGIAIWAVRSLNRGSVGRPHKSTALGILEDRYARGEITPEEFTKGKLLLQG